MATVLLPRSLLSLFPGVERRHELGGDSVEKVAASLGFADAATFRRAFRRWRGAAPRAKVGRDAPA